jgi:hypothetical protein
MDNFVVIEHHDVSDINKKTYQKDRETLLRRLILLFFNLSNDVVDNIHLTVDDNNFRISYSNITVTKDAIIYPNGVLFFGDTLNTIAIDRIQELTHIDDAVDFFQNISVLATVLTTPI